jgi:hypothetical protein
MKTIELPCNKKKPQGNPRKMHGEHLGALDKIGAFPREVRGEARGSPQLYVVPIGWRRSAHGSAVVRSLRYGKHDAIPKAVAESASARESE